MGIRMRWGILETSQETNHEESRYRRQACFQVIGYKNPAHEANNEPSSYFFPPCALTSGNRPWKRRKELLPPAEQKLNEEQTRVQMFLRKAYIRSEVCSAPTRHPVSSLGVCKNKSKKRIWKKCKGIKYWMNILKLRYIHRENSRWKPGGKCWYT